MLNAPRGETLFERILKPTAIKKGPFGSLSPLNGPTWWLFYPFAAGRFPIAPGRVTIIQKY